MTDFILEPDDEEDDDTCPHGIGWDEPCGECEEDDEKEAEAMP